MQTHPRDVLKNCMRCGSASILFQPDNAMQCQKCGFRYYISSVAAVAVLIIDHQGRLLLTERAREPEKGKLDLPGGFVDIGERAEEAVVREIKEELNLKVQNIRYIGSYPNEYVYSGLTIFTLDMAFVCEIADFNEIEASDDVASYRFCSLEIIDFEEIAFKSIRNVVKDFMRHREK